MSAIAIKATEGASSLGCVRCAMSRRMIAPAKKHRSESPANTHSSIGQLKNARITPARMTLDDGPSVVIAPMIPM